MPSAFHPTFDDFSNLDRRLAVTEERYTGLAKRQDSTDETISKFTWLLIGTLVASVGSCLSLIVGLAFIILKLKQM